MLKRYKIIYQFIISAILLLEYGEISFAQTDNFNPSLSINSPHQFHNEDLQPNGIEFKALAVHDSWANLRGGNYRGVGIIGNLNLKVELDTKKLNWWEGGKFVLYGLAIYGRRPSLSVGDYQYTSSIDAFDTIEPYQAYYEHTFPNNKGSFLLGIHDFTTEFSVLSYAVTLINSSFSTPSTITQIPYSFYPYTGLGARVLSEIDRNFYLLAGAYDGKPTNQIHSRSIDLGLSSDDGAYLISELGYQSKKGERNKKIALGAWYNSGIYTDMNGELKRSNAGSYLIGEQQLWQEQNNSEQGVGVFAQLGQARSDRNYNPWYFGAGLNYKGLFYARPKDTLTLAFNLASSSSSYRAQHANTDKSERVVEFSYRSQLTKSITITPDLQWVINPGTQKDLDNSLIFFIRSEVKL